MRMAILLFMSFVHSKHSQGVREAGDFPEQSDKKTSCPQLNSSIKTGQVFEGRRGQGFFEEAGRKAEDLQ